MKPNRPTLPAVLLGAGGRTCIAFAAGRKYIHAVEMHEPVRLARIPVAGKALAVARWPMFLNGKPYPVRRAARYYLRSEISKTGRAAKVLRALARGQTEIRP